MDLKYYMSDGANKNVQAVLCIIQYLYGDGIENSWNDTFKRYDAEPNVARFQNCREQGYVISLQSKNYDRQINIVFYEHRNSDNICALKWEQRTLNSPTLADLVEFGNFKDKYDTTFEVAYDEHYKMAKWIIEQLYRFWDETSTDTVDTVDTEV